MEIKKINNKKDTTKRKIYTLLVFGIGIMMICMPSVFAAEEDPITVVNNLSDFIFQLTRVIGGIIVGYAIIQIGLSFTSHDSSQRVNGFLFFAGGVIIYCAKTILRIIGG